jgi:hypothetical protein
MPRLSIGDCKDTGVHFDLPMHARTTIQRLTANRFCVLIIGNEDTDRLFNCTCEGLATSLGTWFYGSSPVHRCRICCHELSQNIEQMRTSGLCKQKAVVLEVTRRILEVQQAVNLPWRAQEQMDDHSAKEVFWKP